MGDRGIHDAEQVIVRLQASDLPDCIDLARRSFGYAGEEEQAVRNWFDARITNNPWQASLDGIGVGARDRGRLVAFRAMFAQPWWIDGQSTVIAFAAHTCIEPEFRGQRLASRMITCSRDFAPLTGSTSAGYITQKIYAKQGFVAIGGEGNDFFRLRASYVGSIQSRLGALSGQLLGGALDAVAGDAAKDLGDARNFRLETLTACGGEFDELWARARSGYGSCLERSSRYLNWRLFEFPTHPLSLLALRDGQGVLRGYGIWHELRYSKHVSCAVLRDLFVANDDEPARRAFLLLAIRHWRRAGVTWVNLELASDRLTRLFASQGYERIPSRGNRYHIHGRDGLSCESLAGWMRSGLDGDYFDVRPLAPLLDPAHDDYRTRPPT